VSASTGSFPMAATVAAGLCVLRVLLTCGITSGRSAGGGAGPNARSTVVLGLIDGVISRSAFLLVAGAVGSTCVGAGAFFGRGLAFAMTIGTTSGASTDFALDLATFAGCGVSGAADFALALDFAGAFADNCGVSDAPDFALAFDFALGICGVSACGVAGGTGVLPLFGPAIWGVSGSSTTFVVMETGTPLGFPLLLERVFAVPPPRPKGIVAPLGVEMSYTGTRFATLGGVMVMGVRIAAPAPGGAGGGRPGP
jgi:hypothetical protein